MADGTHIEWTEATWNPVTGCSVTSPGCTNCYAMKLAGTRLAHHESRAGLTRDTKAGPVWTGEVRFNEQWLDQPLRWRRPRMIFVCAHGDLFHESVPDAWIDEVFKVMSRARQHTFQVLTKRSARMREYLSGFRPTPKWDGYVTRDGLPASGGPEKNPAGAPVFVPNRWPLPNVWPGVSVEDQQRADERIPDLLATPAAVRWLSCEPLLGAVDLRSSLYPDGSGITMRGYLRDKDEPDDFHYWANKLDWIVAGGESGPGARPMHPDWARSLRDQCDAANVPFFFKQWGEWAPGAACLGKIGRFPAADHGRNGWMRFDHYQSGDELGCPPDVVLWGKKAAGRLLDGVTHDAMPGAAHV